MWESRETGAVVASETPAAAEVITSVLLQR